MQPFSKVDYYKVSPDGKYAVYRADPDVDNVYETFVVPINGGTPQKLDGVQFSSFTISPDSKYIVYQYSGLYSILITGGTPQLLTDLFLTPGVTPYVVSFDSNYVVFLSSEGFGSPNEIYSVPITGGTPQKLNGDLGSVYGNVFGDFVISQDSSRVVYLANQEEIDVLELFSVPITGGVSQKLNGTLVSGGDVRGSAPPRAPYHISSDSSMVVYLADQETDGVVDLYSVSLNGGSSPKLNAVPNVYKIDITPDGNRVIYMSGSDIYSVPITGGTLVKLNVFSGGDNSGVSKYRILSDISRVIYYGKSEIYDDMYSLFSVPLVGGATPQKLTDDLEGFSGNFNITPNSNYVVYQVDQDTTDMDELYRVHVDGGVIEKLNNTLDADADVYSDFTIASNSNQIVYRAGQPESADGMIELFVTSSEFEIFLPLVLK
ncbi:MAG: hypothetical protein DWQ04_23260 [Chloroflexi bacterium]|nr:MAG: hypothetical protein DWQ04_23260 [Chloroflexota bacterium]